MRSLKEELYKDERDAILRTIIEQIGLNKSKKVLMRSEIIKDETKDCINKLMEDIRRYYTISKWRSIKTWKEKELNIINNIMKDNGIDIIKMDKKIRLKSGKYENERVYLYEIGDEWLN